MAQLLKHLACAGVTHLPRVDLQKPTMIASRSKSPQASASSSAKSAPVTAYTSAPVSVATARNEARPAVSPVVKEMRRPPKVILSADDLQSANSNRPPLLPDVQEMMGRAFSEVQGKAEALSVLAKVVASCQRCSELCSTRTQTVFGVGKPNAKIMFIGEAPGADEDARGEPFVGPAGQLLDKIVEASQLKRKDLYICNILRCRPPGNRNPLPQEVSNCREFLDAQIHIVKPEYIVCWGTVAAQNLLNKTEAVGKLRGQFFDYHGIRVMCTYHPSYLLRNPAAKKQVWDDMKFFMQEFGVELT